MKTTLSIAALGLLLMGSYCWLRVAAEYDICRIFFKNVSIQSCMFSEKTRVIR